MMKRPCPVCGSEVSDTLHRYLLTNGAQQTIQGCRRCGMCYASTSPVPVDYTKSIYSLKGAIGSGESEHDRFRLGQTAVAISWFVPRDARILDIGCARGGLLDALKGIGYTNISGLDPDKACVEAASSKGHRIYEGSIEALPHTGEYDCIILSHVLEHVLHPGRALSAISGRISHRGHVYIEVPNASQYARSGLPFLDFNSEHINHFTSDTLKDLMQKHGLPAIRGEKKVISLTNGSSYPAIWMIGQKRESITALENYIVESKKLFKVANQNLEEDLSGHDEVIVWGAGEYFTHVSNLSVFNKHEIVQVVDRNPMLQGRHVSGGDGNSWLVEHPATVGINPNLPIVIAAIVAAESIKRDIAAMGYPNKVITLDFAKRQEK